jgi:large subunit ribosomal protein L18
MNIIRRFLSTSTENSSYTISSRLLNRNPRTLEWQNLQWRSTGWSLQYPPKDYLHRVRLLSSGRHLIGQIDHFYTGNICVQASTREWAIRKHLATCKDRSVAYNLALILSERAEQCGITKIYFGHPHDKRYEKSSRLQYFYRGLIDSNIEFEQREGNQTQMTRDSIDGINYDEHERDVRYTQPKLHYPPDTYQEKLHYFQLGLNKTNEPLKTNETNKEEKILS